MILSNILHGKKYGVVQTVSLISRDFLFLAIKLHCSDRFSSKMDISKVAIVSQNVQSFKKIHRRKYNIIKYQQKPTFSCERTQITKARVISVRTVIKL